MPVSRRFEGIVRAAVRRPGLVVAVCALLAAAGAVGALSLRPSAGTDTLVDRDADTFQATERYHQRFGSDAVLVLVSGDLTQLVLTPNLGRLLGLEGCISGNVPREITSLPGGPNGPCAKLARDRPAQVVYGPGTFINEAVRQIQEQFTAQQRANAQRERRAAEAARRLAAARGRSKADQQRLARQARQLVRAEFLRDTLRLALNYGIRSIPRLNDPAFVSQLVFDPGRRKTGRCKGATYVPKARFAYLFPSECSALIQVRLRPGLSDAQRERAIDLIRQATEFRDSSPRRRDFRLESASYTVSGAPVVVAALTDRLAGSIAVLLVAALIVMAATLLAVFRTPPRRAVRLLPLAVALVACGVLFGAMAVLGASLTMASIAVLPVLVGLSVDYAIQFHSRFDEAVRDDGLAPREAAAQAGRLGGPTIATACLATGAGFLVLALSPVPMVRGFGALLVAGIAIAFGLALTGGFAALALVGGPARRRRAAPAVARRAGEALAAAGRGARDILAGLGGAWLWRNGRDAAVSGWRGAMREATTRPARVLGVAIVLSVIGFGLDTQTRVVSDVQKLVPQDLQALRDLDTVQQRTGVSGEIDVTVEADDLTDPRVMSWMTRYQQRVLKRFGYTAERGCGRAELCPALSLPDLFRSRGSAEDRGQIRALLDAVPPYFSQAVITPDRRLATMAFGIRLMPLDRQQEVIDVMRRSLDPPPGVRAELVGLPVLAAEANRQVSSDWRRLMTVLAGLLAVSLALLLVYRRVERALVPLVPIALAGGWSALVLFLLRVPLNPMSVTLGALVIAISTEFSVLLSERYRQERRRGLAPAEALSRTYASTGAAVAASGATAIAGFAVLILSDIRMLREFGVVAVVDLGVSLLGVLIVLPAVLLMAESGELRELPGRALGWARGLVPARLRRARAART